METLFFECEEEESCSFKLFIGKYAYGGQTADDDDSLTFTLNEGVGTFEWTIHVVDSEEEPVKDCEVGCHFGILFGSEHETTDEDGNAEFRIHTSRDSVYPEIFVDGTSRGDHTIENGDSLTFHIDEDDD